MAVVACIAVGSALAEKAEKEAKPPVDVDQIVTTICAACHGADGNKMLTPETPKIGGQRADYLAKSLEDYRSGSRNNVFMAGVAQALSDDEIEALSAYFAAQESELFTLK
ncbi:MAG: c-type cytochrome [Betaproteobacteria bacterium]|nr:MAG: c-type cytochrome [Betaproteobacteria bacterium]